MAAVARRVPEKDIDALWRFIEHTYDDNRRLYVAGNGGLFSLASHLAIDFSKGAVCEENRLYSDKRRIRVQQLGSNGSKVSAWSNDQRFDDIYVEELKTLEGDGWKDYSLLALSCSGNSPNIVNLVKYAAEQNANVWSMVGFDGGKLKNLMPAVHFKSWNYGEVEDCIHLTMHHITNRLRSKILAG